MASSIYDDISVTGVPAVGTSSPYDDISVTGAVQPGEAWRANISRNVATDANKLAGQRRLAEYIGVNPAVGEALPDEVKRLAALKKVEADTAAAPVLRKAYGDPAFAQVSHDDSGVLSRIETSLGAAARYVTSADGKGFLTDVAAAGRALFSGAPSFSAGAYGALAAPFGLADQAIQKMDDLAAAITGTPRRQIVGSPGPEGFLLDQSQQASETAKAIMALPKDAGFGHRAIMSGLQSAGQQLLSLPLGLVAGSTAMLGAMGATTGGQSYAKARGEGASPALAAAYDLEDATAEIVTEMFLGAAGLLRNIRAGASAGRLFAYELGKEVPGEMAATLWQNFNEWTNLHPEKSLADFVAEQPEALAQTIVATLVGGATQIGAVKGIERAVGAVAGRQAGAAAADGFAQHLAGQVQTAAESALRERSPGEFRALVQRMAENTAGAPREIYVDGQVLQQLPAEVFNQLPQQVRDQVADAAATSDSVAIPLSDVLTVAPGTALEQTIVEHGRMNPFALSQAEARDAGAQAQEMLRTEADRVIQQAQDQAAMRASSDAVHASILEELTQANRHRAAVNEGLASWAAAFYTTMAARVGMTPEAFYQAHRLRILGEASRAAPALEQGEPHAKITGLEFGDASESADTLRAQAKRWYDSTLRGTSVVNAASGREIQFGRSGKAFGRSANPEKVRLFAALPELLANGEIVSTSAPANPQAESNVKAYHWLVGTVGISGKPVRVGVTVREDNRGHLYYNHNAVKEEAPGSPALGDTAYKAGAGTNEPGALSQSVPAPADGINLHTLTPQARGSFNPASLDLVLGPNADLSTFFHETGHFFLEVLADIASQPNAPAQIVEDMNRVLAWGGVADLATWQAMTLDEKRGLHERWAESVEQYVMEGRTPSADMAPLMRRFRAWMTSVYRSLQRFIASRPEAERTPLNDGIREVMDRLLATDEQIAQAEEAAGMVPDEQATAQAQERLGARSIRDLKWTVRARDTAIKKLQKQADAVRKETEAQVTVEVDQTPEMRAKAALDALHVTPEHQGLVRAWREQRDAAQAAIRADLLAHLYADNPDVKGIDKGQLRAKNKRAIDNQVEARMIEWDKANAKPVKQMAADDADVAVVADSFGFESVDAMLQAIDAFGPRRDAIEGLTEQRMLEEHGDLVDERAILEAANEAVHNEARARSLATELKTQAEMLGERTDTGEVNAKGQRVTVNALLEAARQFGANVVARTPLKDLKATAWKHTAAERRAAKAWQTATAKGDTVAAVRAKQDQALHNAAAKAAIDAAADARKIFAFFERVTKGNDEKVVDKGRDPDIVNAARAVLGAYGVATPTTKAAADYLEVLAKNDPETAAVVQPMVDGALGNAQPLTALSFEQLQVLHEDIQAMWFLARRSRQMEVGGDLMDITDAADELHARLEAKGIPLEVPGEAGAVTAKEERVRWLQFARALLRRVEQWTEAMDGKFGGPFNRLVFHPVKDAAERYRADRVQYRVKFQALLDQVAPTMTHRLIAAPELGYTFGRGHNGIGHAELLHALLHTGNASNKRKLLLGRNWATENADGTLDTSRWDAFLRRLANEGVLQRPHFDFAQGVWDLMEQTKPLAQATHRAVFGRYFAEVTADAFADPFGVARRGGYVPAQADPAIVHDADLRALSERENESMAFSFPTTSKGFTKARVEYNRPLKLDLRAIPQHLDKVLLFSHMEPAVRGVAKLLRQPGVSQPLTRVDPAAYSGMLLPWLNRSARQQVETPIVGDGRTSRVLSALRSRAGAALMFGNISNTVQQLSGFVSAFSKLKSDGLDSHMMRAAAQLMAHPRELQAQVKAASPFMAQRMDAELSALSDQMHEILLDPSLYERAQAWSLRNSYFLQSALDNVTGPVIWTAAYNAALEKGHADDQAVLYADSVIRQTQGANSAEDVSRLETGPAYARLFTQFIGYFSMLASTNATALQQIAQEVGLRKGAGRALGVVLFGVLAPIWVAEAIAVAFKGGPGDPDGDGYLDDWIAAVLGMGTIKGVLAQVPFIAQVGQVIVNRFNTNPADDRFSLSPAISLLESAASVPHDVYQHITDKGNAQHTVRDLAALVSLATGLPATAVARPLGYLAGVHDGKIAPTSTADAVRGMITGTASPDSKAR